MKEQLKKILQINGFKMEDIGLNQEQETFTVEEFSAISLKLRLPLKTLFDLLLQNNPYYSANSFEIGVYNGEVEKVITSIVKGSVLNVNDNLYFLNSSFRIKENNIINKNVVQKLFALLIKNGEWALARKLSSNNLYYHFNNINNKDFPNNSLVNYLLGSYSFENLETLKLDDYFKNIFKQLEPKSKKYIQSILMENYRTLSKAWDFGKKQSNFSLWKNELFSYFINEDNHDISYKIHFIDNVYEYFDLNEKNEVKKILSKIK